MYKPNRSIVSRRDFLGFSLRFSSGSILSLPILESLFTQENAYAQGVKDIQYFFAFYFPAGPLAKRHGGNWHPPAGSQPSSATYFKNTALEPLIPYKNMIHVFNQLRNDGFYGSGNTHMRAICACLTGSPLTDDKTKLSPSLDQLLGSQYSEQSNAPTLEDSLSICYTKELDKPNNNRYFNPHKNGFSFSKNGVNRFQNYENDLSFFVNKLVSSKKNKETPDHNAINSVTQQERNAGIIGDILSKDNLSTAKRLRYNLGSEDYKRIEEYLGTLADIQKEQTKKPQVLSSGTCDLDNLSNPRIKMGIMDHVKTSAIICRMAFECNVVRSATYMLAGEASGNTYSYEEASSAQVKIKKEHLHNQLTHNNGERSNAMRKLVDRYHADLFSEILKEFNRKEGRDKSILDQGAAVFVGGPSGNQAHGFDETGFLFAGHANGNLPAGMNHKVDLKKKGTHASILLGLGKALSLKQNTLGLANKPFDFKKNTG